MSHFPNSQKTDSDGRRWLLVAVLLLAFGVRLHTLLLPDVGNDEAWSYAHAAGLASGAAPADRVLGVEPNNALHLLIAGTSMRFVPGVLGLRWPSLLLDVLSTALVARAAFRLFGRKVVLWAALFYALATTPVTFAQLGRPYALATTLALASLVTWLESAWRRNLLFSALLPFAHVGAMPVVLAQDFLALTGLYRPRGMRRADWLFNRLVVYGMFGLVLLLVYLRRASGMKISVGQPVPTLWDILFHFGSLLHGGAPNGLSDAFLLSLPMLLFGVLSLLLVGLIWMALRRRLPRATLVPLVWIAAAYGVVVVMAVVGDGPIFFHHITAITAAAVLLVALILARVGLWQRLVLAVILGYFSLYALSALERGPYRDMSEVAAGLREAVQADELVYTYHYSGLWALELADPELTFLRGLAYEAEGRPDAYLFLGQGTMQPPTPPECDPTPFWTFGEWHLHRCEKQSASDAAG